MADVSVRRSRGQSNGWTRRITPLSGNWSGARSGVPRNRSASYLDALTSGWVTGRWRKGQSPGYRVVVCSLAVRHNERLDSSCRLRLDDTPAHRLRVDITAPAGCDGPHSVQGDSCPTTTTAASCGTRSSTTCIRPRPRSYSSYKEWKQSERASLRLTTLSRLCRRPTPRVSRRFPTWRTPIHVRTRLRPEPHPSA